MRLSRKMEVSGRTGEEIFLVNGIFWAAAISGRTLTTHKRTHNEIHLTLLLEETPESRNWPSSVSGMGSYEQYIQTRFFSIWSSYSLQRVSLFPSVQDNSFLRRVKTTYCVKRKYVVSDITALALVRTDLRNIMLNAYVAYFQLKVTQDNHCRACYVHIHILSSPQ